MGNVASLTKEATPAFSRDETREDALPAQSSWRVTSTAVPPLVAMPRSVAGAQRLR